MSKYLSPKSAFIACKVTNSGLLFFFWIKSGETAGFFLFLFLIVMSLLRWCVPKLNSTVILDFLVCAALMSVWEYAGFALSIPLLESMYLGIYWLAIAAIYAVYMGEPVIVILFVATMLCGLFLRFWENDRKYGLTLRDSEAERYYELESLQNDLVAALAQIERIAAVAERTRIARDIHDNAGHEIVAAYISFQAVRNMLDCENAEIIELYDAALERLDKGVNKIRTAVHNLSAVAFIGIDDLREKCRTFPVCNVEFNVYGDTTKVPIYVWSILSSCLNEGLTNIARHSAAKRVSVDLDTTLHIVRLCIENDGVIKNSSISGTGLRNLRHRATAIGGSVSLDIGDTFRMICVMPIHDYRGVKK